MVIYLLLLISSVHSFEVLIAEKTNLSECSGETGYEVELVKRALKNISLTAYTIRCVTSLSDGISEVSTGSFDGLLVGGVPIDHVQISKGLDFSYPTYRSGVNILLKDQSSRPKIFDAFSDALWGSILALPFILSLVALAYAFILKKDVKSFFAGIPDILWQQFSSFMLNSLPEPQAGAFMSLIIGIIMTLIWFGLVAAYSSLLITHINEVPESIDSFSGSTVIIEDAVAEYANNFSFNRYAQTWSFYTEFSQSLGLLEDEDIKGIVGEHSYLISQTNDDYKVLTHPFVHFFYGCLYGTGIDSTVKNNINKELANLSASNYPSSLSEQFGMHVDTESKSLDPNRIDDFMMVFSVLMAAGVFSLLLSFIPIPGIQSHSWDFCCKKEQLLTNEEIQMTSNRVDTVMGVRAKSENEMTVMLDLSSPDIYERRADNLLVREFSQENTTIIRNTMMALIIYENSCLNKLDNLEDRILMQANEKERTSYIVREFNESNG